MVPRIVVTLLLVVAGVAQAQTRRPPESGGRTVSLGQPPRLHWQGGLDLGALRDTSPTALMVRARVRVARDLLSPDIGLGRTALEVYGGVRGPRSDGGARALFEIPYFGLGAGADYNVRDRRVDLVVTGTSPIRRGGIIVPGGQARLTWVPARGHSLSLGLTIPLADPLVGRGRPIRDYVVVSADFQPAVPYAVADPAIAATLDSLRSSAEWIRQFVAPYLDHDGRSGAIALARTARVVQVLRDRLAIRSADAEVRHFHRMLDRAFVIAALDSAAGLAIAAQARAVLLDEVLLPYDRLVGQKRRRDTLEEAATAARGRFSRWVVATGAVTSDRVDRVLYVFQQLTLMMDDVRRAAAHEWTDPRLVWLPLQYALLPEDHDEQEELDRLVERATGARFRNENRVRYLTNLQFHWDLLRMIRETRSYHVLWIHDYPAVGADRELDWASLAITVDGYLTTLAERVEAYDETRTLPSFFVFLDQHYYELRRSRLLMSVLEDPLSVTLRLPHGVRGDTRALERALERLRTAVRNSRVLQAEARQYGQPWLHNRVGVHVNITNRPDASFWGGSLVATLFGYPDNIMRDHRKIAFRDVSEDDPWAGVALLTGMGVGSQYLGPTWEDRSLLVEGPVLLDLRRAARELLLSQGMPDNDLPLPLRDPPELARPPGPRSPPATSGFDTRAMLLVNGTGYLPKPLNVAKAVLYSLAPPASRLKIPDSLWNASFYAGLLVGACLRGAHVSVVSPALSNAPSAGFPQLSRAHELFTRLLVVADTLAAALAEAGGSLRVGLYAVPADVQGFADRAALWAHQVSGDEDVQALMPFRVNAVSPIVRDAARPTREPRVDGAEPPRLHLKVQVFVTGSLWTAITGSPAWPEFMATYLRYREATHVPDETSSRRHDLAADLMRLAERVVADAAAPMGAAAYAMVGSQNQDYRGMFMDGEVGVLFGGSAALVPLLDLAFLEGTVTWITDQATLDRLLPPAGEMGRRFARAAKDGL